MSFRTPLFTPTSARDLHRNLAEWFASREAQRWSAARYEASAREQQGLDVDKTVDDPQNVRRRLLAAETFLVTDEMSAVCRQAGRSLPDIIVDHAVLPAEIGFMVFNDRPAEHEDDRLIPLPVQAVLWWPGSYYDTAGVCIETFLWPDTAVSLFEHLAYLKNIRADRQAEIDALEQLIEGGEAKAEETVKAAAKLDDLMAQARADADRTDVEAARKEAAEWTRYLADWRFPAMPTLMTYLPYGRPPPEEAVSDKETNYTARMVLAAWRLMDQPLAVRERGHVDRPAARRAARAGLVSDLTVITLRQPKNVGPGEGSAREYHSRWIVRGHWRRIPTSDQPGRVTWVHGYVKGPHDAPLVMKDRVTVLAR